MEYVDTPPEVKGEEIVLKGSEDRYSKLQIYFLRRLNYLLRLRQQQRAHGSDSVTLRLLDRAIFASYRDCAAGDRGRSGDPDRRRLLRRLSEPAELAQPK
jgi:hypothetical protein